MEKHSLSVKELIIRSIDRQQILSPAELRILTNHVTTAPFATGLLQADPPLWGGFWHFDVIAPGYRLPADELALLRATRLDGHWPQDTPMEQYLLDLRRAVQHPQAGVWSVDLAGEPGVIIAATEGKPPTASARLLATVVWYCASTDQLHAGYRAPVEGIVFTGAIEQRPLVIASQSKLLKINSPEWLVSTVEQLAVGPESSLTARLDAEILRRRLG